MTAASWLGVCVLILVLAAGPTRAAEPGAEAKPPAAKLDPARLVGSWEYDSGEKNGQKLDKAHFAGMKVEITRQTIAMSGAGGRFAFEYSVDPAKSPAAIALKMTEGIAVGATAAGIVGMHGDRLTLCYGTAENAPAAFETKEGGNAHLFVLTRVGGPATAPATRPATSPSVGAAPAGFDARRDGIPRGTVETVEYDSKSVGVKRKLVVYTPPGYAKGNTYPVLYLLHGIGDDETGWTKKGSAADILDNLHADKALAPMIVVMPNGRASAEPPPANPFDGDPFRTFGAFGQDLLKDVIPFVERTYRAKPGREHRALAGLSMGGGQSLNFGLGNLDTFAYVGGFSSAPNTRKATELVADPAAAAKQLKLLWVSCGDRDNLMNISRTFHEALDGMNVPHVWHVDAGGHTWPVWKNDLYLFAQRLFR